MTDLGGDEPFVDLVAGARRLGSLRWIEQRLFEVLGATVREVTEPATKAALATLSRHHAWHAELLAGVLPTLPNVDGVSPDGLTVAPHGDPALGRLVDDLTAGPADTRLEHVRGSTLPTLIDAVGALRAALSPVGDRPAIRVLGLVLADEQVDLSALPSPSD